MLDGLNFTIGMNGYEPGGKECPINLKFRHVGGSNSSFKAYSNLFFFNELSKVLPAVDFNPVLLKLAPVVVSFLTLFYFPLSK